MGSVTVASPLPFGSQDLELEGGQLALFPAFLDSGSARALMDALQREVAWSQHYVHIAGRRLACPRLSAWYGDPGARYRYSGQTYDPTPFLPRLEALRVLLEENLGTRFNSVLLNAYRDGNDAMGWHSDDEPELGEDPTIASLSLGETRRFRLRHRERCAPSRGFDLEHGSLLVMDGPTQRNWQHAVPRTRRTVGPRLNLTWRRIEKPSAG